MISVTIEVREATLMRRVQITAPSIERALEIAGEGKPGRRVRLLYPIDPGGLLRTRNFRREDGGGLRWSA